MDALTWLKVNAALLGVRDPEALSPALLAAIVEACGPKIPLPDSAENNDAAVTRADEIAASIARAGQTWPRDLTPPEVSANGNAHGAKQN